MQNVTNGKAGIVVRWRAMHIWQKVLVGLLAGFLVGVVAGQTSVVILEPIGRLFLNAIKMLVVPLVFASLVCGVISINDPAKMGRVGLKTFLIYLATTAVAISIGLSVGLLVEPGSGLALAQDATAQTLAEKPSFADMLVAFVPANPAAAIAEGNILQIIVFALVLGLAINKAGNKARPFKIFMESFSDIVYKLTDIVIALAPYGVFALIASVAGKYGTDILLSLGQVIISVYVASLLHILFTMGGVLLLISRLSPVKFFRGIGEAQMVAFSTTSSSGTLPVTLNCVQQNLGVSKNISSFVLPMGATINMDGTAIYVGVVALFVAQSYGVDLTTADYVTIILTSTLASIGTAGVPGGGLIMLSLVLTSVGLPIEGVGLIAGVDRLLDMARTTVNVTGDGFVSVVVATSEDELDRSVYAGPAI